MSCCSSAPQERAQRRCETDSDPGSHHVLCRQRGRNIVLYKIDGRVVRSTSSRGSTSRMYGCVLYPGRKGVEDRKRRTDPEPFCAPVSLGCPYIPSGPRRRAGICSVARSISAFAGVDFPRFGPRLWGCSVPEIRGHRGGFPIRVGGRSAIACSTELVTWNGSSNNIHGLLLHGILEMERPWTWLRF